MHIKKYGTLCWKSFCLMFLLSLLLVLSACGTANQTSTSPAPAVTSSVTQESPSAPVSTFSTPSAPLLWKVTDPKTGGILYLFGSIHVGTESMYPLPDAVMDAYQSSDALAVECDIVSMENDLNGMMNYMQYFLCPNGERITDHLSPETYQAAVSFLTENSPYGSLLSMFQTYNPAFWASLVDDAIMNLAGFENSLGLDHYFLTLALQDDQKEVLEVESLDFQFQLIAQVPDALQDYLIRSAVSDPEKEIANLQALYEAVRTGDETALNDLLFDDPDLLQDETLTEEQKKTLPALMADYEDALYNTRNVHMAETAASYLQEGRHVFFVVGMGHMLGENGIVARLAAQGYSVTQIKTGS